MRRVLFAIAAIAVFAGVANARPARAPRAEIAQAGPAVAANPADRALADVASADGRRGQAIAQKRALAARYQQQLAAVDDLKRQRASWRRDRQLERALADSLETARQLAAVTQQITNAEVSLARARAAAVAAIDAELATGPAVARKTALTTARARQASALAPAHAKKIVLPDDTLDPLADPEELEAQAAALRESEAELARQVESLGTQADRFARQAELVRQHRRADDLAMRDDADPRRTGGGSGTEAAGADPTGNPSPPPNPPQTGSGGGVGNTGGGAGDSGAGSLSPPADRGGPTASFEGQPDRVLADVIDAHAIDALRRADQSTDPAAKATAASAARDQVAARLRRLRERRAAIEARARDLRKP